MELAEFEWKGLPRCLISKSPAIHLHPHFRALGYRPGDFPSAEDAANRVIALP